MLCWSNTYMYVLLHCDFKVYVEKKWMACVSIHHFIPKQVFSILLIVQQIFITIKTSYFNYYKRVYKVENGISHECCISVSYCSICKSTLLLFLYYLLPIGKQHIFVHHYITQKWISFLLLLFEGIRTFL